MKSSAQSMDPQQAAQAFFGLKDADFDQMVTQLTKNDPRLLQVFKNTRARFLDGQSKSRIRK